MEKLDALEHLVYCFLLYLLVIKAYMSSSISQFCGYAKWWLSSKVGGKDPLVNTMLIHYGCNLRCKHCEVVQQADVLEKNKMTYDEIVSEMEFRFKSGARIMYFEGGEPTIWGDSGKDLGDLIEKSHEIGYYNVGYTTNGNSDRIFTNSDVISISLDGPRDIHDEVRGKGVYDKLMETLGNLEFDGSVFANMVIQRDNLDYIEETAKAVKDNKSIDGIMYNFLTPPPYELAVDMEDRLKAVDTIKRLKAEGHPILNSKKGLELLRKEDWERECPQNMSMFTIPGGHRFDGCPMRGTDSCKHCGFSAVREYYLVKKGNPSTIMEMSSMFAMSKK